MNQNLKPISAWQSAFRTYCHANHFDLEALQANYGAEGTIRRELRDQFLKEFDRIIAERSVSLEEFEVITGIDFDSESDLYSFVIEIRRFLFEGGSLDSVDRVYAETQGLDWPAEDAT